MNKNDKYEWQYSSFTNDGQNCVGLTVDPDNPDRIGIEESDYLGVVVWTTRANLAAFIAGVKAGEFDAYAQPIEMASQAS